MTRPPTPIARACALRALVVACGLAFITGTRVARADPIDSGGYRIDLFQGPLLSPIRAMALGGAFAGYGEGIAGLAANAAAPAVREANAFRHTEVDLRASFSVPINLFENNDFDNSGDIDDDTSSFIYLTAGAILQVGAFGAGVIGELSRYSLDDAAGETTRISIGRYRALGAASLVKGQLALGGGVRISAMTLDAPSASLAYAGASPELGILVRPNAVPFRFGATYRFAVIAHPLFEPPKPAAGGPLRAGALVLPEQVELPWELESGVAFQIGPRPLNVPFIDPEDEDDAGEERVAAARKERARERARIMLQTPIEQRPERDAELREHERSLRALEDEWLEAQHRWFLEQHDDAFAELPRERLLVLLSLLATGPVEHGVGLEGFLEQPVPGRSPFQVIGSSGAATNFSPRFGIEAEPLLGRLVLRAGSYYEPSRFGNVGRAHFTFGSELRLFSTSLFGLLPELPYAIDLGLDLAPRYESISASVSIFR